MLSQICIARMILHRRYSRASQVSVSSVSIECRIECSIKYHIVSSVSISNDSSAVSTISIDSSAVPSVSFEDQYRIDMKIISSISIECQYRIECQFRVLY